MGLITGEKVGTFEEQRGDIEGVKKYKKQKQKKRFVGS